MASWNNLRKGTFLSCFRKEANQNDTVADIEDPFKALQEDICQLRQCHSDLVPQKLTADDVVHIYSNIITTEASMIDAEILALATLEREDKEDKENGI